ncbi:MAG: hypothetical protein COA45_09505 [Zetaproteobacteria bacterium]|nr:MAG: hypothetical protein COA45_09505 [Zetaproteobacteria bacterium]
MFNDDLPKPKAESIFPRDIEFLSVSDLNDYIDELKAEIDRVEKDMHTKETSKSAAASFFK